MYNGFMDNHICFTTANRASSLLYSYLRLLSRGGTWLIPVNVCPVVPLTFCLAKVPFEFVDINSQTMCMDIEKAVSLIKISPSKYSGVLFVRTYGYLADTSNEFKQIKALANCIIIDDRCLCIPECRPFFFNSDIILYSTGHCKQIDLGAGGVACCTNNIKIELDKSLYYNGTDVEEIYKDAYKTMTPLSRIPVGWLSIKDYICFEDYFRIISERMGNRLYKRDLLNKIYDNNLPESIKLPNCFQEWRYNIIVPTRIKGKILDALFLNGLYASNHYNSANKLFDNESYPVSDSLYSQIINLFNDDYYTEDKALRTCNIINSFLKEVK